VIGLGVKCDPFDEDSLGLIRLYDPQLIPIVCVQK